MQKLSLKFQIYEGTPLASLLTGLDSRELSALVVESLAFYFGLGLGNRGMQTQSDEEKREVGEPKTRGLRKPATIRTPAPASAPASAPAPSREEDDLDLEEPLSQTETLQEPLEKEELSVKSQSPKAAVESDSPPRGLAAILKTLSTKTSKEQSSSSWSDWS